MQRTGLIPLTLLLTSVTLVSLTSPCWAYIGPGAGMVFLSSFLALLIAFVLAFVLIVLGLFRWVFGFFGRHRARAGATAARVIIVGLDGYDPQIAEKLMAEGRLPNLSALAESGTYCRLRTTCPPMSPVAWSTFATGTNPGKHNIFDFLRRDPRTYQVELSSTQVRGERRTVRLGRYSIPFRQPKAELLQKSKTFWEVLGESGIFAAVMRVPLTYPPRKFRGVTLSGMCAPDLLGTQGTFTYYTTDSEEIGEYESGLAVPFEQVDGRLLADIVGPDNPIVDDAGPMTIPMTLQVDREAGTAQLAVQGQRVALELGRYSGWVPLAFRAGPWYKVRGVCQFSLLATVPEVRLYQSPINVDPNNPTMPISSPLTFSTYLAKAHGTFATLGLAEDTWALNENILSEQAFLEQCYMFHRERRKLFWDMFNKVRQGALAFVFDITDRTQHMFLGRSSANAGAPDGVPEIVEQVYRDMDELIGEVGERLDDDAVLLVMSDHGFGQFSRCFDLNRWLCDNGYVALKGQTGEHISWFDAIDWSRTRAYGLGLNGIYLNLRGRESRGIVEPEEATTLKQELIERLRKLSDPKTGQQPIRDVFASSEVYSGPYTDNAPDLIVGYRRGYRVSWDSVVGKIGDEVLSDNPKPWAADHCMHPAEVPGVLFCSRKLDGDDAWIGDIGPTVLGLLGVEVPTYMDGRRLDAP